MRAIVDTLYDLGSTLTEDLQAWNSYIEDACGVCPFAIKPQTGAAIRNLLAAIEEEYMDSADVAAAPAKLVTDA
jgi:hypothetical protein